MKYSNYFTCSFFKFNLNSTINIKLSNDKKAEKVRTNAIKHLKLQLNTILKLTKYIGGDYTGVCLQKLR